MKTLYINLNIYILENGNIIYRTGENICKQIYKCWQSKKGLVSGISGTLENSKKSAVKNNQQQTKPKTIQLENGPKI